MTAPMTISRPAVALVSPTSAPVRDRGPLLDAAEVAAQVFQGKCGWRWVLDNAPHQYRMKVGKKVCFHAADMLVWKDSLGGK